MNLGTIAFHGTVFRETASANEREIFQQVATKKTNFMQS
jgi:hypothetical protein